MVRQVASAGGDHAFCQALHPPPQADEGMKLFGNHGGFLDEQLHHHEDRQHDEEPQVAVEQVHIGREPEQGGETAHDQHGVAVTVPGHEQVMDVAFVRLGKLHALEGAPQDRREGVNDGNHEQQDGQGQRHDGARLESHERDGGNHESQEQGPAVAHEDARGVGIEHQEPQGGAGKQEADGDHVRTPVDHGQAAGDHEDDHGHPASQAVQAVNQVHRIGDAADPEDREEKGHESEIDADPERQPQYIHLHAAPDQHQGGNGFKGQLHRRLDVDEVIHQAGEKHYAASRQDPEHRPVGADKHGGADHERQVNGHAPNAGNQAVVDRALVFMGVGFADHGILLHQRRKDDGNHERQQIQTGFRHALPPFSRDTPGSGPGSGAGRSRPTGCRADSALPS